MYHSAATTVDVNPIHIEGPKNRDGARSVNGLVAKKIAITGRVAAIPNTMPTVRSIHSR